VNDLIPFLRARLFDDVCVARAEGVLREGNPSYTLGELSAFERIWDPARVLVECEAKGEVIDWCAEVIGHRDLSGYEKFGSLRGDRQALAVTLAVEVLRLLVVPYVNHPDYQAAWGLAVTGQ
jgi:hypothetical protein